MINTIRRILYPQTPQTVYIEGIDVAFWETMIRDQYNKLIYVADFERVRQTPYIRFFIWKATQGMFTDPSFYQTESDTRGWVPRTTYHYLEGNKDGYSQAMYHLEVTSNFVTNLPDIMDCEHMGGATGKDVARRTEAYIRTIHDQTKKFPMIYTAAWFWDKLPVVEGANECLLFDANYTYLPRPYLPKRPWNVWTLWQWLVTRLVPGLRGGVDHDRFYGSEADFQSLISNVVPPSTFPKRAIVVTRSLWIRNAPDGQGIGGLKKNDMCTIYEVRETYSGKWARISIDSREWACMVGAHGEEYMKFLM